MQVVENTISKLYPLFALFFPPCLVVEPLTVVSDHPPAVHAFISSTSFNFYCMFICRLQNLKLIAASFSLCAPVEGKG